MRKQLHFVKQLSLGIGLSILSVGAFAQQQIYNSDFEQWGNLGTANERPSGWNDMENGDLCTLCAIGKIQTCWQSTDIRPGSTGSYSVKIVTGEAYNNIVNGTMTIGKLNAPTTTPSAGYTQTDVSDSDFNQVLTDKPDSIVFWAKYSVTDNSDSARISTFIHDNYALKDPNDASSQSHLVATAIKNFQTGGNWKRISLPFNYASMPSTDAQFILITISSSYSPGAGVNGATLYIDDMKLIYNNGSTTGINNLSTTKSDINVYAFNKNLKVDMTGSDLTDATLKVYNITGQQILEQKLNPRQMNTFSMNVSSGIYIYSISNNKTVVNGKVLVK